MSINPIVRESGNLKVIDILWILVKFIKTWIKIIRNGFKHVN